MSPPGLMSSGALVSASTPGPDAVGASTVEFTLRLTGVVSELLMLTAPGAPPVEAMIERRIVALALQQFVIHPSAGRGARHRLAPLIAWIDLTADVSETLQPFDGAARGLVGHPAGVGYLALRRRPGGHHMEYHQPRAGQVVFAQHVFPGLLNEPGRHRQQPTGRPAVQVVHRRPLVHRHLQLFSRLNNMVESPEIVSAPQQCRAMSRNGRR